MPEISLIQIDNYGPWTVTPNPKKETDIQRLQAGIYRDISSMYGVYDCLAFYNRFDNIIALTNGMTEQDQKDIQTSINNSYPITISIAAESNPHPSTALEKATEKLQKKGSAQDKYRANELLTNGDTSQETIYIAHFDANDFTEKYTDTQSEYLNLLKTQEIYLNLMKEMHDSHGALTFFVGGDNYISICPDIEKRQLEKIIETVDKQTGSDLKVGIGRSSIPAEASIRAKHALEECRENRVRVSTKPYSATR